ncbi:hypothetical protein B0T22DRAFT_461106 [Podospora appendiculata]|uniref:Uncharacterized protein n=1 Tax=Podospora appendiculata TaxID=314037 RepID=A0AAE0XAR7_9PEZI|nr:hypothetical protein B0T22DRAFT_461106 [Podospora appendiculata]
MQLTTILATFALAISTASGVAIQKRPPILGGFTMSTTPGCPMMWNQDTMHYTIGYGSACGDCVAATSYSNQTFKAITDAYLNPKCRLTLYQKADCSDDGAVTGPTCWTPDGGIAAYKVDCPWWGEIPPDYQWIRPCYKN